MVEVKRHVFENFIRNFRELRKSSYIDFEDGDQYKVEEFEDVNKNHRIVAKRYYINDQVVNWEVL